MKDRLLEPRLEITLANELFDFTAGYRWTRTERGEMVDVVRENIYSRFFFHKEKLPETSLQFDRIRIDDRFGTGSHDTRILVDSSYDIRDFSLYYNFEKKIFETKEVDFKRDGLLNSANVQYQKSLFGEKVHIATGCFINNNRIKTESRIGIPFYVEKEPKKGLFSMDDTPLTGALEENASLIDGDTAGSTGIEIGGTAYGGGINRNIGLQFDPPQTIDTFFLSVSASISPLSEEDFSWDLYTSEDDLNWTRVGTSIPFTFDYTLNRFEITFSPVSVRYVKLVNTGHSVNEGQISVTELQAFMIEVLVGKTQEAQRIQNFNLNLNVAPSERFSLTLGSFVSFSDTERGETLTEYDLRDNNLTFFFRPWSFFSTTAGYSLVERRQTLNPGEDDSSYFLSLNASFFETLDISLGGRSRSVEKETDSGLQMTSYLLRIASQLYRDLNASLDLGYVDQKDESIGTDSQTKSLHLTVHTKPREEIILSSDLLQEYVVMTDISGIEQEWDQTNWSLDATFRPSSLLNCGARLLYQDLITIRGWSKIYRLDWLPFPGGTIQLNLSYEKDIRDVSGEKRDQARGELRWNIQKNAYLSLSYYLIDLKNEVKKRSNVLSALLEIRF